MTDSHRSTPAFAIGGIAMRFVCKVCGDDVAHTNHGAVHGICEQHCTDHEYEYDRFDRSHYCTHCGAVPPDDWYHCDDDVGFGSYSSPGEVVGIPLSAMDGNAANRHNNPDGWANWVAFCNANGHL